jgi:hypothetical protein
VAAIDLETTARVLAIFLTASWLPASAGRRLAHGHFRLKAEATQSVLKAEATPSPARRTHRYLGRAGTDRRGAHLQPCPDAGRDQAHMSAAIVGEHQGDSVTAPLAV